MCWCFEAFKLFFMSVWAGIRFAWATVSLRRLQHPIVTIFGGKRAASDSFYTQQTYQLAHQLVSHNYSVLTGGGPGVMEAANCGAQAAVPTGSNVHAWTLGIGVRDVNGNFTSRCTRVIKMPYFYMRKWLLMRYSVAFVVFPGGIGTADELFELLNLMKLHKLPTHPIILVGAAYWQPLLHWFTDSAIAQGFVPAECKQLFTVTDDIEKVLAIIECSGKENRSEERVR